MVEYEQNGSDRAEYGAATLKRLSAALKTSIGRGFSVDSLELMRRFYLTYEHLIPQTTMSETTSRIFALEISETTSRNSAALIKSISAFSQSVSGELLQQIKLSWSNYVTLLTIDKPDERRFYEIEATKNSWSVRELERQVASSLYERLALSRDKEEIRRLSQEAMWLKKPPTSSKIPLFWSFSAWRKSPPTRKTNWNRQLSTGWKFFCSNLGRAFSSRHARSDSLLITI